MGSFCSREDEGGDGDKAFLRHRDLSPDAVLENGEIVTYAPSGARARILEVHHDDDPPYYTIMIDGHEKQTVRSRLIRDGQLAPQNMAAV